MPSVVIAAHNEEAVLGACLASLMRAGLAGDDIVVVANGCSDRTADVAREQAVVVVDRPEPGKAAALNAGDAVASGFPRVYLDADIVVPPDAFQAVMAAFDSGVLAAVPRRRLDVAGRPWPVRGYFAINDRLPVFRDGLFGRGMIALSAEGRSRFTAFPELVADDLFLDSQFSSAEKREVDGAVVVVATPFTTRDLVRRLVRVRRGNGQLRSVAADGGVDATVRPSDRWAWLRVVAPHPALWLAGVPYVAITVFAALAARRAPGADAWGRDETTRTLGRPTGEGRPS
jgi:glycosyltransferase involved in cell wall biosynthesis